MESRFQEKDREMSMITVDYRQLQYKLDKLEAENRQECEKARSLGTQVRSLHDFVGRGPPHPASFY